MPLLLAAIVGCTATDAPNHGFVAGGEMVHDSAGVRIVESDPNDAGSKLPWHVEADPLLRIGEVDGDPALLFTSIMSVAAQNGTIAVADQRARDLRLFDMGGVPLAHVTRLEPVGPDGLGFPRVFPDPATGGFVLVDAIAAAGGFLDRSGQVTDVFRWRPSDIGLEASQPVAWTGQALVLWSQTAEGAEAVRQAGGMVEQRTRWAVLHPGDPGLSVWERETRVPVHYMAPELARARGLPAVLQAQTPLSQSLHLAARDNWVFKTSRNGTEILRVDTQGSLIARYRIGQEERPVTNADVEREARAVASRLRFTPQATEAYVEYVRTLPSAEVLPRFTAVVAGPAGEVWARNAPVDAAPAEGGQWTVFDPTGVARGSIALPAGFTLFQVEEDWILGTTRDETGVPSVVIHALDRRVEP